MRIVKTHILSEGEVKCHAFGSYLAFADFNWPKVWVDIDEDYVKYDLLHQAPTSDICHKAISAAIYKRRGD
jgi:hypothetical protein